MKRVSGAKRESLANRNFEHEEIHDGGKKLDIDGKGRGFFSMTLFFNNVKNNVIKEIVKFDGDSR